MSDLTDFLLARIAEDEAVARDTLEGEKALGHDPASRVSDLWGTARPGLIAVMAKPSRVMAECAAKRATLKDVESLRGEIKSATPGGVTRLSMLHALDMIEHRMVLLYAEHQDFNPAWAV